MSPSVKKRVLTAAAISAMVPVLARAQIAPIPGPSFTGGNGGSGGVQANVTNPVPKVTTSGTGSSASSTPAGGDVVGKGYPYYPNSSSTAPNAPNVDSSDPVSYVINSSGGVTQLASLLNNPNLTSTTTTLPKMIPAATTVYGLNINAGTEGLAVGNAAAAFNSSSTSATSTNATVWDLVTGGVTALNPNETGSITNAAGVATSLSSETSANNYSEAGYVINSSGAVAGFVQYYKTGTTTFEESIPTVWSSPTAAPAMLASSGVSTTGTYFGSVYGINTSGQINGDIGSYDSSGNYLGQYACVWAAGTAGTTTGGVTLLPTLNTGTPSDVSRVINDNGVVAGYGGYSVGSSSYQSAVRWSPKNDGSGTYGIEQLQSVGYPSAAAAAGGGENNGDVYGINKNGDVVGIAYTYATAATTGPGNTAIAQYAYQGSRALLWKAGTTTPIALGIDGTSTSGITTSIALAINDYGFSVGSLSVYNSAGTQTVAKTAALWSSDGTLTELDNLAGINPLSPPTNTAGFSNLIEADGITNDGYISGYGMYDPDGSAGSLPAYQRAFLLYDPAAPEPGSVSALLALAGLLMKRRGRRVEPIPNA